MIAYIWLAVIVLLFAYSIFMTMVFRKLWRLYVKMSNMPKTKDGIFVLHGNIIYIPDGEGGYEDRYIYEISYDGEEWTFTHGDAVEDRARCKANDCYGTLKALREGES